MKKHTSDESFDFLINQALWPSKSSPLTETTIPLGEGDFTVSLRACWTGDEFGSGDLISQFDREKRKGFTLSLSSLGASCTSQSHIRKIVFGVDSGTDPNWVDLGNPGGQAVYPFALCEFRGQMFVGIFTNAAGGRGAVFRFDEGRGWIDCGCPCRGNAVTAMTVLDDILYVAGSCYDASGTHLAGAANMESDGHVFAFDGTTWQDCGKVSDCLVLGCLGTFNGQIYATAFQQFTDVKSRPDCGLYRMTRSGEWKFCGNPGERVVPFVSRGGEIVAGGYNDGGIYSYNPETSSWKNWGKPVYFFGNRAPAPEKFWSKNYSTKATM